MSATAIAVTCPLLLAVAFTGTRESLIGSERADDARMRTSNVWIEL
jgi:hypothetical protein